MNLKWLNKITLLFTVSLFFIFGQKTVSADSEAIVSCIKPNIVMGEPIQLKVKKEMTIVGGQAYQFNIFKDLSPLDFEAGGNWWSKQVAKTYTVVDDTVPLGNGDFVQVNLQSLNYPPGDYFVLPDVAGIKKYELEKHFAKVTISAVSPPQNLLQDMVTQKRGLALYNQTGGFLADAKGTDLPSLNLDTIYILALDLNRVKETGAIFSNTLRADFYDGSGTQLLKEDLILAKVIRSENFLQGGTKHPLTLKKDSYIKAKDTTNGCAQATELTPMLSTYFTLSEFLQQHSKLPNFSDKEFQEKIKGMYYQQYYELSTYQPNGFVDVSSYANTNGIALIYFKTPWDHKYIDQGGQVHFLFRMTRNFLEGSDSDCNINSMTEINPITIKIRLIETQPSVALPDMKSSPEGDHPFDTLNVKIVHFGGFPQALSTGSNPEQTLDLSTQESLNSFVEGLKKYFSIATKNYFNLSVNEVKFFPFILAPLNGYNNPPEMQALMDKIKEWYLNAPKTPGKPSLDFSKPVEFYLIACLYYEEHPGQLDKDMKTVSPPYGGEMNKIADYTLYLFDGETGSKGIGSGGSKVAVSNFFDMRKAPPSIFYEGEGPNRTYQFVEKSGKSPGEYLLDHQENSNSFTNISIHEMGHNLWIRRSGFSTGDQSDNISPYQGDPVVIDKSYGYFTRYEYMSYGRNRYLLDGMSYGDQFLETLLATYKKPEVSVEFLSPPDEDGDKKVTLSVGEGLKFKLKGKAPSGLAFLQAYNKAKYADQKTFKYMDPENTAKRVLSDEQAITLSFSKPGTYVYVIRAIDRLDAIVGHEHTDYKEFTVEVLSQQELPTPEAQGSSTETPPAEQPAPQGQAPEEQQKPSEGTSPEVSPSETPPAEQPAPKAEKAKPKAQEVRRGVKKAPQKSTFPSRPTKDRRRR